MSSGSAAPLLYDTHMHTPLCRHAVGEPEAYAAAAQRRNLKGIVITCHNPFQKGEADGVRMAWREFPEYVGMIQRARKATAPGVDVRLGLECDFFPGMEKDLAALTRSAPFDYILGSVHPHLDEYQAAYWHGNAFQFQRTYFDHLAMAAETRLFDCLAHPDVVKNLTPQNWDVHRLMPHIRRALDRIASAGCAMELNTSGLTKEVPEMMPGLEILREMRRRAIAVVIGSDAHQPNRVGDSFEMAFETLNKAGFRFVSFFLSRHRHDVPLTAARRSLNHARRLSTAAD